MDRSTVQDLPSPYGYAECIHDGDIAVDCSTILAHRNLLNCE